MAGKLGSFTAVLGGDKKMVAKLRAAGERGTKALAGGLYLLANDIRSDAVRRAPKDDGPLRGSGYATLPVIRGTSITLEVGFGGPAAAYAARQHEETTWHHDDGEAKYLQNAFDQIKSSAMGLLSKYTAALFKLNSPTTPTGSAPTDPGPKVPRRDKRGRFV